METLGCTGTHCSFSLLTAALTAALNFILFAILTPTEPPLFADRTSFVQRALSIGATVAGKLGEDADGPCLASRLGMSLVTLSRLSKIEDE